MQILTKSFKKQVIISLIILAGFSILVSISVFLITNSIYRNKISAEIEDSTEFISQSIDNFFEVPGGYLTAIKNHLDKLHSSAEMDDPNCIINDLVMFMNAFESVYLLSSDGIIMKTWPRNEDFLGIDLSKQEYFIKNAEQDRIYWSDTFLSNQSGLPTVALTIECELGEVVAYYNLNQLGKFISIDLDDAAGFIAVLDNHGNVVAHTDPQRSLTTENLSNMESVWAAINGNPACGEDYYNGIRGLASVRAVEDSSFFVMIFKSYDMIFRALDNVNIIFTVLMFLMIASYGLITLLILKNFLKPLDRLQETFKMVASGSYNSIPETDITEFKVLTESFNTMVDQIHRRESDLKTSISDREMLMKELNHRTKNNMQLIVGLIRLYSLKNPDSDPQGILNKIQTKIETISMVHNKLYRSQDFSSINFREYLEDLIPSLLTTYFNPAKPIRYDLKVEKIFLNLDRAVPCGLILNELITNSIKYAFSDKKEGMIRVAADTAADKTLTIHYSDDGQGLGKDFNIKQTDSLGFSIIRSIVTSQLRGTFRFGTAEGFSFSFSFMPD